MSDTENTKPTEDDLAGMSDEDFMNVDLGSLVPEEEAVPEGTSSDEAEGQEDPSEDDDDGTEETVGESGGEDEDSPEARTEPESAAAGDTPENGSTDSSESEDEPETAKKADPHGDDADPAKKDAKKADKAETDDKKPAEGEIDYKAAYDRLMAPFKANGQMFTPQSPEELIKLAQMGANYSKKMNGLQPHLKTVRMLQENNILDDAKLSFLIDLDRGEPAAIKKLLKDKNIDPMDVDTSEDPGYKPVDRRVSDESWNFTQAVEDVGSSDFGKATINTIHTTWDTASKDALFKDPNILRLMNEQRQSGVYDQVANEIERRKMLGDLSGKSFLQAYQEVGTEMTQQGKFAPPKAKDQNHGQTPSSSASPRVVDRGTAKRKTVENNDKAKAASSPKSRTPGKKPPAINPLELSDDDFMKASEMGGRF